MDFFAQQDRARRNTRFLVLLFCLAVILLVFLVNGLITAFLWIGRDYNLYVGGSGWSGFIRTFSVERFATVSVVVFATIALVSLVRWVQLASGGKVVAESMGGRRVLAQSDDPFEKRCLNIVEELSLAASMPAPALYVLPDERGINAFAAGVTPADAVVAVTRGTLLQLKRDELQGVIGHEFSHILNGDMRLGIRLASLLKGITFIGDVGHFMLRAGAYGIGGGNNRSSERSAALPIMGLALLVIGWLGSLSAGFIKAAISRQKEYLADASAVQFTRDTSGIAGALKAIGGFLPGSLVHAARAQEMSHLFFGEVRHALWDGFATHPPLERRILRLDAQWDGKFITRKEVRYGVGPLDEEATRVGVGRAALVAAAMASARLNVDDLAGGSDSNSSHADQPDDAEPSALDALPIALQKAVHDPLGATAIALAMLVARDETHSEVELKLIADTGVRGQAELVKDMLAPVGALPSGQRFPLLAIAMPALKSLSTPQYRQFKTTLLAVISADQHTDLFEWCLFQLLRHYLDPEYLQVPVSRPRYAKLGKLRTPLRQVLSLLAHQGEADSQSAFDLACDTLGLEGLQMLPSADCKIADFSRAVHTLADCYPLLKPQILKAMALAAADDGQVSVTERELVVAVAAVMDCPPPPEIALH